MDACMDRLTFRQEASKGSYYCCEPVQKLKIQYIQSLGNFLGDFQKSSYLVSCKLSSQCNLGVGSSIFFYEIS